MSRSRWLIPLLSIPMLLPVASSAMGQPQRLEPERSERVTSADLTGSIDQYLDTQTARLTQGEKALTEAVDLSVPAAVATKTTSTAPPDAFADRVGDAIADFLPFFQFAVDSVSTSEDRRSVTLKANPILGPWGALSTQVTLAEPEVLTALAEQIAEPVRTTQQQALLKEVGDFGDVTASLHFGLHRQGRSWSDTRWLLGRDYSLYEPLVHQLVTALWSRVSRSTEDRLVGARAKVVQVLRAPPCDVFRALNVSNSEEITFEAVRELEGRDRRHRGCMDLLVNALDESAAAMATLIGEVRDLDPGFDALPALIDNQPQLVATGSYRFADDVVGPESWSLGLQYELGSDNFNRLLREVRSAGRDPLDTYHDMVANRAKVEDASKLVFGVTYTRRDDHDVSHSYRVPSIDGQIDLAQPALTTAVSLPRSEQWRGKLLYTRFMPEVSPEPARWGGDDIAESADSLLAAAAAAGLIMPKERPRFTAGVEFVETDDPSRQDQIIGRVSYVLPLKGGLTLPVTLSWANKGEFLGEQNEVIGGHVGISYGFDRQK